MTKLPQNEESCFDISRHLLTTSTLVLKSFAKFEKTPVRDRICRDFLARSAKTLKSITALWSLSDYQGVWILHRTLLDRLFHLHDLIKNDTFSDFDDWSFYQQFKAQNRLKSDREFGGKSPESIFPLTQEQIERAKKLSLNPPDWRRPKAENVAKEMGMSFLYKYSYDHASAHVHPMTDDGFQDYFHITGFDSYEEFPSQITGLSNSILIMSMIYTEVLDASSLKWNKKLWEIAYRLRSELGGEPSDYESLYLELFELSKIDKIAELK